MDRVTAAICEAIAKENLENVKKSVYAHMSEFYELKGI